MKYLIKKVCKYFKKLEYLGVHVGISYLDNKKIRMLNLIALGAIPLTFYFAFVNWGESRYLLSVINVIHFIASFYTLILQRYRRYKEARFILITLNFLFFAIGGYFFNNGGQYLLLMVLIVIVLVYDKRWIQISASIVIMTMMTIIALYPSPLFAEQYVPASRINTNFIISIVFTVVMVLFFKEIHYSYQAKIEEQHAKLKEMNNAMENIFSIIAHDIRSPLISVQYMLHLFQKDIITKQMTEENIAIINNRIVHLNTALDNLLQWGTRNIHGLKTFRQEVSVSTIIQEVLDLLLPQASQKDITLETEIEDGLEAYVDKDQITVVLRNIISNAIKYSFFGERILISAKVVQGKTIISITDRGVGMTKDKQGQLFKNLQIPTLGTDGEGGSGIGLLLSKELLIRNGGSFSIDSQPDIGSTFTVTLPGKNQEPVDEIADL